MENNSIPGLDKKTTLVILVSSGVLLTWSAISSVTEAGPVTASIITYLLYAFYWFYAIRYDNPLIKRLLIFGTIAGVLELATDYYLVDTINSLVYPGAEPMIWRSPAYMPMAWSNVLLQLSFVGVLLTKMYKLVIASVVLCIAGGMYIPLYEHLAKDAGWWWYQQNTFMVFNAPFYIIVCEALISLSLPVLVAYSEQHRLSKTMMLGVAEGIWILVSAIISFYVAH